MKASEKQTICKKLVTAFKKRFHGGVPKSNRPVLETILFAVCLENTSDHTANETFDRLQRDFHDLNEIRVSSISELEHVFHGVAEPEWKALRVRSILHYIFENQFAYDFEILRRKSMDLAAKQLAKINYLSDFVRSFTLQMSLDSHIVPVDDNMCRAAVWLGLAKANGTSLEASAALKPALKKNDVALFCHLLRCFATDAKIARVVESDLKKAAGEEFDPATAVTRLADLFKRADARPKKSSAAQKKATSPARKKAPVKQKKTARAATSRKKTPAAKETKPAKKPSVKKKKPAKKPSVKKKKRSSR